MINISFKAPLIPALCTCEMGFRYITKPRQVQDDRYVSNKLIQQREDPAREGLQSTREEEGEQQPHRGGIFYRSETCSGQYRTGLHIALYVFIE